MQASPTATGTPPLLPNDAKKQRTVRTAGWLLIVLGPCLSLGMAVIVWSLANTIIASHEPGSASRWTGTPAMTQTVFSLLGTIFVLGLATTAGGIYQVRAGRRHPVVIAVILILAVAIVYFASQIV